MIASCRHLSHIPIAHGKPYNALPRRTAAVAYAVPESELRLPYFDFRDPNWPDQVNGIDLDWQDFWDNFDTILRQMPEAEEGAEEDEGAEQQGEAEKEVEDTDAALSVAPGMDEDRPLRPQQKVHVVLKAIPELRKRADFFEYLVTPHDYDEHRLHVNVAKKPEPEGPRPERAWDEVDFRAFREKEKQRERWDQQWWQQQRLLGQGIQPMDMSNDARIGLVKRYDMVRDDWTHEEIWNLITQNGRAVDPREIGEDSFTITNPYARADYYAQGVRHIPETEDILREMGHWLDPDEDDIEEEVPDSMLEADFSGLDGPASEILDEHGQEDDDTQEAELADGFGEL